MKDDVLIKSNKYGITIYFNSDNSFEELLDDVKNKFQSAAKFFNHAKMAVEYEGRSFTEEEERQLTRAIESAAGIEILCIIEKNTATEQVHKKLLDESLEAIHERDGQFYKGTLRGRQVLESEQSIVIIGDVEEGATVASKGNVIVTGTIYGTVIAGADRALVVTTPEVSSIRDADRIIGLLEQNQIRTIDLIINRIRMDMVKRGDMMSVDDVTEILAVPLIGILPDDEQVVIGTNQGEPVIGLDSKAGKGYLNICKRITGTEVSFMNLDTGKGLFSRISHAFRKN